MQKMVCQKYANTSKKYANIVPIRTILKWLKFTLEIAESLIYQGFWSILRNKKTRLKNLVWWWERVDSNHRSHWRQIYSLFPLATRELSQILKWSWWTDSNPRPADYKSAALPTELHQRLNDLLNISQLIKFVNTFSEIFQSFLTNILNQAYYCAAFIFLFIISHQKSKRSRLLDFFRQ